MSGTVSRVTGIAAGLAAALAAGLAGLAFAAGQDPIYLGVLVPPSAWSGLRVVFRVQDGHWEPMPEAPDSLEKAGASYPHMGAPYPQRVSWTVAFDGGKIGVLNSAQPPRFTDRTQLGMQIPERGASLPHIRDSAGRFPFGGFRPLVAISQPNFTDPDGWKPFRATDPDLIRRARAAYRQQAGGSPPCNARCPDASLLAVPEGYRSARGEMLVAVMTATVKTGSSITAACQCEGALWDPEPDWFLVRNGVFQHVGRSLTLIDAGDYDGDGVSEILFWREGQGDGRDAYVLLCPRDGSIHEFAIPGPYTF